MIKNLPTNARDTQTWVPCLGQEDPLEKEVAAHSGFLPGRCHGQRSLVGCSPWGHRESDMTQWVNISNAFPVPRLAWSNYWSFFFFIINLAAPSLSCILRDLSLWHVGSSSPARDQTWAPALGAQNPSYRISKEVPEAFCFYPKDWGRIKGRTSGLIFSSGLTFGASSGLWVAWKEGSTGETRTRKELNYDGRERIRPQDGYRWKVNLFWVYLSRSFNKYLLSSFFVPGTVLYTRFIMVGNVSTGFAQLPKVYKKPCRCYCWVTKSCLTLWNPMMSPTRFLWPWAFLGGIMVWVTISLSRESPRSRDRTHISCIGIDSKKTSRD